MESAIASILDETFSAMRKDGQGLTLGQETTIRTAIGMPDTRK